MITDVNDFVLRQRSAALMLFVGEEDHESRDEDWDELLVGHW